jgi:hypothetical protein
VTDAPNVRAPLWEREAALASSSTRPQEGTILFTRAEMNAWVNSVKAGEFDDMVS